MARAPKVFAARVGFFDTVVAAPSRKAALAAWGAERDWFAEGLAAPTEEAQAVADATASPLVVLRRPAGGSGAYSLHAAAADIPTPPRARTKVKKAALSAAAEPPSKPSPPPDRSALDAAEGELASLEREKQTIAADFERRREQLEAEAGRALAGLRARERRLRAVAEKARAAFAAAGGEA